MTIPSKTKLKNFRSKIKDVLDQELALRRQVKRLYEQFMLDVDDDAMAQRHVRQIYFQIQKHRVAQLMKERLEFHPFFTANPFKVEELEDGDDDII
jgi:hypothetical protein